MKYCVPSLRNPPKRKAFFPSRANQPKVRERRLDSARRTLSKQPAYVWFTFWLHSYVFCCIDCISNVILQDPFAEDDFTKTGKDVMCSGETYYSEEGEVDTCKPVFLTVTFTALLCSYLTLSPKHLFSFQQKKKSKLKGFKKHKPKVNQRVLLKSH